MADDTVQAARAALKKAIWNGDDIELALDVLEAAIRTEHPKLKAVTARCRDCGSYCDDIEFEYESR